MTIIAPEGLLVAQAYLSNNHDILAAAKELGIPEDEAIRLYEKKETQNYISQIFNEAGFRNRDRMGRVWDEVIASKLEELDETGMGSSKDIVEILEKAHKFNMDQLKMQLEIIKAQQGNVPTIQVNNQTNNNYNNLLDKIYNEG